MPPDSEDRLIRSIFEGTAAHTGPQFFTALVRQLAETLGVAGAWVTELDPSGERLRAYAFWFQDRYIQDFEYAIAGTPCEPVIRGNQLFQVPDNLIPLYPNDPDLPPLGAVSYAGIRLTGVDGAVLGHLAILDTKPYSLKGQAEVLFRIFGARATAEIERLRAESETRDHEQQLRSLIDSAWDAIAVINSAGTIVKGNKAASELLGGDRLEGARFIELLSDDCAARWTKWLGAPSTGRSWMGDLQLRSGHAAEASISGFERCGQLYWTVILRKIDDRAALERESQYLRDELAQLLPAGNLLGECPAMRAVAEQIRQVAPTEATVLINGETGTGKEVAARAIHEGGGRKDRPLIRVNCAAIPAALMESEFFGHERGAFTGATQRREGRFQLADGGTLFLDEIGELPLDLQVKLLRVLQEGEFEPVGSSRTRKVNVRLIAATNRDLAREAAEGRFRPDLYYRLNVFPITLPPLRERGRDIVLLAGNIVDRLGQKMGRRFRRLSSSAENVLLQYDWPGNVRELENVLERAAILTRGDEIHLPPSLFPARTQAASVSADGAILNKSQLEAREKENLTRALEVCGWRVSGRGGAAELLGMPASTVASRMKALGVGRRHENS